MLRRASSTRGAPARLTAPSALDRGSPQRPALRVAVLAFAIAAPWSALAGCTQDHDVLGKDPPTTSTTTGAGGAGGGGAGGAGGEGGAPIVEPSGPTKLTVLNGINDYSAIKLCFLAYPDGTGDGVAPWPAATGGLPFARVQVIDPIASVIPQGDDVRPYVIAGTLAAAAGLDCAEAIELAAQPASPLVVAGLPVVPASAFKVERSLLLVPLGCVGGLDHTASEDTLGCGPGYTIDTPTASLAAVAMSRVTAPDKVSLQVVGGSLAMPAVDVRVTPGFDGATDWQVAPALTSGAIAPFPPFQTLEADEYGSVTLIEVKTFLPGQTAPTSTVPMSEILSHSAVAPVDFANGRGFSLVAVGAAPGVGAGPFWHGLTYTLVDADP